MAMWRTGLLLVGLALSTLSGCAMCCGTDDETYAAHGGRWQRADMVHGRVGSRFSSAGYRAGEVSLDEVLMGESVELEETE